MTQKRLGLLWPLPALLALALLVAGPLLALTGTLPTMQGFYVFLASGLVGLLATVWGLWFTIFRARSKGLVVTALALVPLLIIGKSMLAAGDVPRLNDVSTDLDNPPRFDAARAAPENAGKNLDYPEEFKEPVLEGYPGLISKRIALPYEEAFALVRQTAATMPGWTIVREDLAAHVIEGSQTSQLFRFTDDFVIRVDPADGYAHVNMRSRSRLGQSDFGVNAKRIQSFFAALDAKLGTTPPEEDSSSGETP